MVNYERKPQMKWLTKELQVLLNLVTTVTHEPTKQVIYNAIANLRNVVVILLLTIQVSHAAILTDQAKDFYKRYDSNSQPVFQSNLDGLALLSEVDHYFNRTLKYMPETKDYWQTPAETIAKGGGDCEDIALAKWSALKDAGIPEKDMRLKVGFTHAVLIVTINGEDYYLDNMTNNLWEQTITEKSAYTVNRYGIGR